MEIKPQKNYKKPAFAVGLASLMVAAGTSGCTDGAQNSSVTGNVSKDETSLLSQPGVTSISTDSTTSLEYDGGLELVGEVEFTDNSSSPEETEILELDGDVVCPPDDNDE